MLLFRKKGRKTIPIQESKGHLTFHNEMGEKIGEMNVSMQADRDKIRHAKLLKIKSDVNGDSKEIEIKNE